MAVDNSGSQSLYYFFSDGRLRTSYANSGGWNPVQLESNNDNGSTDKYGGLNPTDQATAKSIDQNNIDDYYLLAVNPVGPPPGSSAGSPAPILRGGGEMSGLYESTDAGLVVTQPAVAGAYGITTAMLPMLTPWVGPRTSAPNQTAPQSAAARALFFRSAYGLVFNRMFTPPWGSAYAAQIVADPNDPQIVYVLDTTGRIWVTSDGLVWTDLKTLTNLPSATQIEVYDPTPYTAGVSVLLAGTQAGASTA